MTLLAVQGEPMWHSKARMERFRCFDLYSATAKKVLAHSSRGGSERAQAFAKRFEKAQAKRDPAKGLVVLRKAFAEVLGIADRTPSPSRRRTPSPSAILADGS